MKLIKYTLTAALFAVFAVTGAFAQSKLDTGTQRAADAAKVLNELAGLPENGAIPKQLLAEARVIAVFPKVTKVNLLIQKMMKGYGVASRRVGDTWSTPAFYGFGVADKGWTKVKSESPAVVIIFTGEGAIKAFEREQIDISGAVAGPVGTDPKELERIGRSSRYFYIFDGGELRGAKVSDDSDDIANFAADNGINKAVYGIKGKEVINDTAKPTLPVPSSIEDVRKALATLVTR